MAEGVEVRTGDAGKSRQGFLEEQRLAWIPEGQVGTHGDQQREQHVEGRSVRNYSSIACPTCGPCVRKLGTSFRGVKSCRGWEAAPREHHGQICCSGKLAPAAA